MTRAPPSTAFVAGTFRAYDGHAQTGRLTFDGTGDRYWPASLNSSMRSRSGILCIVTAVVRLTDVRRTNRMAMA